MEMQTKCADLNRRGRELRLAKDQLPSREKFWFRLRRVGFILTGWLARGFGGGMSGGGGASGGW